jgi:hypothetical protein
VFLNASVRSHYEERPGSPKAYTVSAVDLVIVNLNSDEKNTAEKDLYTKGFREYNPMIMNVMRRN